MRKVNGKLISKLNVFALMIVICLAMLFSGLTDFNQVHADVQPQDVEVSNLKAEIDGISKRKISFNVKINRKVKRGETIRLKIGYDKVDSIDSPLKFDDGGYGALTIKEAGKSDVNVGTLLVSGDSFYLTFGKNAEKFDTMDLEIKYDYAYDLDSFSIDNQIKIMSLPFYITLNDKNVTKENGVLKRTIGAAPTSMGNHNNVYFKSDYNGNQSVMLNVYLGKDKSNPFVRSGKVVITLPDSLDASSINGGIKCKSCKLVEASKPTGDKFLTYKSQATKENCISLESIEGNKITFNGDFDKFGDAMFHIAMMDVKYKEGYSYKNGEKISLDFTDVGGYSYTSTIVRNEAYANGSGSILDVSKYQPEASPIIVHKGDKLDNKMITDHVIIKDKDEKTVKAEDINASKTRVDNNKIDTNTVGNYSATVNVEYKDGSTENVTVPIKVIDNVIPNLPDENGKNPEKPDGYVTVTMNAGQHGMLAKGEAKEYFVNPEKVVTIPAKDAIGKLGYKFSKWDSPLKAQFKKDKTINAKYKQLPDVIPNVPDHNGKKPEKPDGYVTVVVDPGNNGKLDPRDAGEYFVNPTKEVTIPIHNAVPNDGYKFNKWSPSKTGHFDHDMTIKAKYLAKGNANKPQTGDNGIEFPLAILISTIGMAFVAVKTKKHI